MPPNITALIADVSAADAPAGLPEITQSAGLAQVSPAERVRPPVAGDPHHGCVDWFSYWTGFGARTTDLPTDLS